MHLSDQQEETVEGRELLAPAGSVSPVNSEAGQPEVVTTKRVETLEPFQQRVVFTLHSGQLPGGNRLLAALFAVAAVLLAIPFFLLVVVFLAVVVAVGLIAFSLSWMRSKWFGGGVNPPHITITRNHPEVEN